MIQRKKIYLLIIILSLILIIFAIYRYTKKDKNNVEPIDRIEFNLSQVYPDSKVINVKSRQEYLIDSVRFYTKEFGTNNYKILIIAETFNDDGVIYRLYNTTDLSNVLKKVESLVRPMDYDQVMNSNIIVKDITGDGIDEFLFKVEISTQVTSYEVLFQSGNEFENIRVKGSNSKWISFDSIDYMNGFIYATWHATDARGTTKYSFKKNILDPLKNVGIFILNDESGDCEIRVNKVNDEFVALKRDKCDLIWDRLDEYLE